MGGGIPGFARNARSACYGDFGSAVAEGLNSCVSPDINGTPGPARMHRRSLSLPHPGIRGGVSEAPQHQSSATTGLRQQRRSREYPGAPQRQATPNRQCAAAKQKQGASGNSPSFRTLHTRLSDPSHRPLPVQNPRKRRCERSGRSPECRRQSLFLLHHQKAHSLFPRKKRMGVLKPPGFPGTPS